MSNVLSSAYRVGDVSKKAKQKKKTKEKEIVLKK
jgi:hypothetical protein